MSAGSCSSGSTPKSTSLADFWSLFNEEPLDENRRFWVKRLFLLAPLTDRAQTLSQNGEAFLQSLPKCRTFGEGGA
jgi:hypothetical protein